MIKKTIVAGLFLVTSLSAYDYTVLAYGGLVANAHEDFTYKVSGEDDIKINNVELDTKPFVTPKYYGIRISVWDDDESAWEFEHTHQKLYIADSVLKETKLNHWEMTDGFNFFFVNKAWKLNDFWDDFIVRVGTGLVVSHPDITYEGVRYHGAGHGAITAGEGYDLSGFVFQGGVQKIFFMTESLFFSLDARITYASAWAEDEMGGLSVVDNKAFHFNYGIGYKF